MPFLGLLCNRLGIKTIIQKTILSKNVKFSFNFSLGAWLYKKKKVNL